MPARPRVGRSYPQEYLPGHAENHFRIVSVRASVRTPAASASRALHTTEWTPLEPAVIDRKLYVRGMGTVLETTAKAPRETNVLVRFIRGRR